jgi:FMN phosphatase YigB (HAD superfamily)
MKKIISICALSMSLYGGIIKISCLNELFDHAGQIVDSLVLFDMQDTLVRSVFYKFDTAVQETLSAHLQPLIGHIMEVKWLFVKPIEAVAGSIIRTLEERGALVGVLTGNHHLELSHIFYQLAVAGISLPRFWDTVPKLYFTGIQSCAFADRGVISTGSNKKSEILLQFLERMQLRPKRIIFVDNSLACLQDVEQAALQLQVPFVGLWYIHPKYHQMAGATQKE